MSDNRYDLEQVLWPDLPFDLMTHAVLIGKRGSEAHGTYVPPEAGSHGTDDRDIMAVCVPPISYYFGVKSWDGTDSIKDVWDVCTYSLRKYVSLLVKQNPNVVSLLWLRVEDYLHCSEEGKLLVDHRDVFSSKKAFASFAGYANDQLKRMMNVENGQSKGTPRYATGFLGAKRKALVEKYGYDTKNAAHLIRLLKMGTEFIRDGVMNVYREKDAAEIINIKLGRWPLSEVKNYSDQLFAEFRAAYEKSPLPEEPDLEVIDSVSTMVTTAFFERVYYWKT